MEKYAYNYARSGLAGKVCVAERESKRIAMPEMFDIIAGSDTGAIIASTLILKNSNQTAFDNGDQINEHFAQTSAEFFEFEGPKLFTEKGIPVWMQILITAGFAILVAIGVYSCCRWRLDKNDQFYQSMKIINTCLDTMKDEKLDGISKERKIYLIKQLKEQQAEETNP